MNAKVVGYAPYYTHLVISLCVLIRHKFPLRINQEEFSFRAANNSVQCQLALRKGQGLSPIAPHVLEPCGLFLYFLMTNIYLSIYLSMHGSWCAMEALCSV